MADEVTDGQVSGRPAGAAPGPHAGDQSGEDYKPLEGEKIVGQSSVTVPVVDGAGLAAVQSEEGNPYLPLKNHDGSYSWPTIDMAQDGKVTPAQPKK